MIDCVLHDRKLTVYMMYLFIWLFFLLDTLAIVYLDLLEDIVNLISTNACLTHVPMVAFAWIVLTVFVVNAPVDIMMLGKFFNILSTRTCI